MPRSHIIPLIDDRPTVSIFWIKRALCPDGYRDHRLKTYLTLLIEAHGFPRPLPSMLTRRARKGQCPNAQLTLAVTMNSRWHRDAVEAWLADFLPPQGAAAIDRAARETAALAMDQAAGNLQLIQGGRA